MQLFFDRYISELGCAKGDPDRDLVVLLEAVQAACKSIARLAAKGALGTGAWPKFGINVQGEVQMPLDVLANDAIINRTAAAVGVHDGGAKRCGGETRGESLHGAGSNQRQRRIRRHEHDHGDYVERQSREDRRTAADVVR